MVAVVWSRYSDNVFVAFLFAFVFIWVVTVNHYYKNEVNFTIEVRNKVVSNRGILKEQVKSQEYNWGELFNTTGSRYLETEELKDLLNSVPEPIKPCIHNCIKCSDVASCVTAIINTHGRLNAVNRQLKSIASAGYGDMKVIVVNDMEPENENYWLHENKIKLYKNVDYHLIKLPDGERLGIGRGRNIALSYVKTPFFLQLDDDFIFNEKTKLATFVEVLATTDTAIVGGQRYGFPAYYGLSRYDDAKNAILVATNCAYSDFLQNSTMFTWEQGYGEHQCHQVDRVINFFMGKTSEVMRAGGWDPRQLYNEHEDFFIRVRREKLKVANCQVYIDHKRIRYPKSVNYMRIKSNKYLSRFLHNYNLSRTIQCTCADLQQTHNGGFSCTNSTWGYKARPIK